MRYSIVTCRFMRQSSMPVDFGQTFEQFEPRQRVVAVVVVVDTQSDAGVARSTDTDVGVG